MSHPFDGSKAEPRAKDFAPMTTLWVNEKMHFCSYEPCNFADVDPAVVQNHEANVHLLRPSDWTTPKVAHSKVKTNTILKDAPKGQTTTEGKEFTEDDRRRGILDSLSKERYQCPFCFNVFQDSRVTREFLDTGKLSMMAFCKGAAGGCGKRMKLTTMLWTRGSPRDFGREIGGYVGWWFKLPFDRDEWMKRLKTLYPKNNNIKWDAPEQPLNQFWLGYGDSRPEFAEKQRVKRMEREYAEANKGSEQEDDSGS